ncbi:MAG TPA: hypothetical protein VM935_01830 [Chitinophagaceae bacterium]|nr:hypothetical protein [Chitinophagaceae bacterium]
MKKAFYLLFFCFGFVSVSGAQQAKTPPKVTIVKYTPPAKKGKPGKKVSKESNEKPPKVDLSNYKPPAKKD